MAVPSWLRLWVVVAAQVSNYLSFQRGLLPMLPPTLLVLVLISPPFNTFRPSRTCRPYLSIRASPSMIMIQTSQNVITHKQTNKQTNKQTLFLYACVT